MTELVKKAIYLTLFMKKNDLKSIVIFIDLKEKTSVLLFRDKMR